MKKVKVTMELTEAQVRHGVLWCADFERMNGPGWATENRQEARLIRALAAGLDDAARAAREEEMPMTCGEIEGWAREAFASGVRVRPFSGGCEVSLPLLDSLNDFIRVYVVQTSKGIEITDYGMTISQLKDVGVRITGKTKPEIFESILRTNGVEETDGVLTKVVGYDSGAFQRGLLTYAKAVSAVLGMDMEERGA